ncbi:FAD-dependent oxidoreductase [Olivibacter domesticus]|uniref:FAD dependent oxidoreductase n=1 Tax=Olivibacter domesticus TaxID=407022 RepID=A0A1H7VQU2_OLID1|nr:FAD-dependent oxidoreductase [Olivibacter domesticus]SEM11616.1 FAD dependent oxidoreductase [Olivibacter domesticus]
MVRVLLIVIFSFLYVNTYAQKKTKKAAKPQVLVYGHDAGAFSAAIQSAQSGVETLLIIDSTHIGGTLISGKNKQISTNHHLDIGTWAFFLRGIANVKTISDSASRAAKNNISPRIAQNVFEGTLDTVQRLSFRKNLKISALEKSGKNWQVTLSSKEKIKVKAIVDASLNASLSALITKNEEPAPKAQLKTIQYNDPLYRTGIAVGAIEDKIFNIPLKSILPDSNRANYFVVNTLNDTHLLNGNDVPITMLLAQACGAAAAYCAFFDVSSDKINARTLQGELLAYKSFIMPFQDVSLDDPHATQIQHVGATGILQGVYKKEGNSKKFLFLPDSLVSSKQIEPVIKQLFTRSQIWFKDKNISTLKSSDVLSLIKYVANRGDELDAEVEKGWKKRFRFKGEFKQSNLLTRRQLAVLLDTYLQPFNVRITSDGNFQY